MTPKQFIEKAIEGGYPKVPPNQYGEYTYLHIHLLNPLAWKAVGKIAGWKDDTTAVGTLRKNIMGKAIMNSYIASGWEVRMHWMVEFLCDGKTIEEFLETL